MAGTLKTFLDKLKAGSPKIGAWFRTVDFQVEVDFGAPHGTPAGPHSGIRVKSSATGAVAFHAPFNGWAQLVSPRQGGVSHTGVKDADKWVELVSDPALRGLRRLDGKPFRPCLNDTQGYTLLFTCFPSAYLRLKWLFQTKLEGAGRLAPHRFAVTINERTAFAGDDGVKKLNRSLQSQGIWSASPAVIEGIKAIGLASSDRGWLTPPSVQVDWDKETKVEPPRQYYAPVGAEILTATTMDLVVFDEYGWPLDPVYVWHAFAKIAAEDAENLQAGYEKASGSGGSAKDPLKDYDLCAKTGTQGSQAKKRITIHTVGMHGEAAEPYLRRALAVESNSGFELDSVTQGKEPPVRRATPQTTSGATNAQQLKLRLDIASDSSKSQGVLGLAPSGTLAEKSLEHKPLDYDFVRVVLVDLTRHVARNRPVDVTKTAADAFSSSATLRDHKKETVVTPLYDGLAVLGAVDELLQKAAEAADHRVAWMAPRLDPFLDLKGYRGGGFPLEKKAEASPEEPWKSEHAKWESEHEQNLAALGSRLAVHTIYLSGSPDIQLLVIPNKTLPCGAYVRIFPLEVELTAAQARRGSGTAARVTKNGGCLLPLSRPTPRLLFDLLVVAREGDSGVLKPHFRGGFEWAGEALPAPSPPGELDFGKVYLGYDAGTGKPTLTFDPTCSPSTWYVVIVNPRTGWLYDSAEQGQKAGGGLQGQSLILPLCNEENSQVVPRISAGEPVFVGITPAAPAITTIALEGCTGWRGFAFPTALQAAGLVPLPASSILKRLVESGKGDSARQWVMVHKEPLVRPVDERVRARILDQALEAQLDKQFFVDERMHGMAERRESALYVHTKPASGSSEQEAEQAVLCSAPIVGMHGDSKERSLGDPQAEPGRAKATVGIGLQGRGSHALYKAISQRARAHCGDDAKTVFPDHDTHSEVAPAEQAVKDSTHRVACLRTLSKILDGNSEAQAETLAALSDAIRQATTSIYIEGPFLDLYDREERQDKGKLQYQEGHHNLLQLLHDQLRKQTHLRVIVCTPREIRHPWGAAVEAGWYEARKNAVRTLRYDGHEKEFVEGHQAKPPEGQYPQLYTAAALAHDRAVVFHPLTPEGRPVDLVATVVIVDDSWALVGDAGLRRRSLTFDAGINLGLTDLALQEHAPKLVRSLRIELLKRALALPEQDSARLADFDDAFDTVAGLCQRNLAGSVTGYQEIWSHIPGSQPPSQWRDALDPDGTKAETEVMGLVAQLFAVTDTNTREQREVEVKWQVPQALQSQEVTYTVSVREQDRLDEIQLSQPLKPATGGALSYKLKFLDREKAYDLYIACAAGDGKTYRAPKSGWGQAGPDDKDLVLGAMNEMRQVRLTWKLPTGVRRDVMTFTLSYRTSGAASAVESISIDLLPDTTRACRCPLALPDPSSQYELFVEGELESRKYRAASWKSAGSAAEVDMGELQAA